MRELYEAGLFIQAYRLARDYGGIDAWPGCEAQILGGRLAARLGAPRAAARLHLRAWRANRRHPVAAYFRAAKIFWDSGPLRALRFLESLARFPEATAREQADLLCLRGRALAAFRDFYQAENFIAEAVSLAPEEPWIWCEKAEVLCMEDDRSGALECVRRALVLRPHYRPAVQVAARLLGALKRDAEALAVLSQADANSECGAIACQLGALQTELGDHPAALRSWLRAADLHPMAEPAFQSWLAGCIADAYYHAGHFDAAREQAEKAGEGFYRGFAERLASQNGSAPRRVVLPVGFEAQSHMTCAPATLSALSLFWNTPVDQATLAAEICYEGTYDHIERHWAERKGFSVREFRLTWEAACALVDRGVPFSVATVETASAHLQAVIGYDLLRRTLILRDPSLRYYREVAAEPWLERYSPFGPRAMLLLPAGEIHRLDHLSLPDADLYDTFYRLQRSLERHDREAAAREFEGLRAGFPGHRLAWWAARRLALYDADPVRELEALDGLLGLFPDCGNFLWSKALVLGRLASGQQAHRDFLRSLAVGLRGEPVFWREWGRELGRDGRRVREGRRYLRLALRNQPVDADNLGELANSLWDDRQFKEATELYRLAACLPGGGERFGRSYFLAARHVRETGAALDFLRRRFESAAGASVQPTRALFFALSSLDRNSDALDLLDKALLLRPSDGELLLLAADEFARNGRRERAKEVLEKARGLTSRTAWLRAAAAIAGYDCDQISALPLWREVLQIEPLAADAAHALAGLVAETEGIARALKFIEDLTGRFPHYEPFLNLLVEWLRDEPPEIAEPPIRRSLGVNPDNVWMRRELALCLAKRGFLEEAMAEAREALAREPLNPPSHGIFAEVLRRSFRFAEAAEAFRSALRLSIDYTWAMTGLFGSCQTFEEKRAAVEFLRVELVRQVVFGDSVSAFRSQAYAILGPEVLLAVLREAHEARPDLWQTWVAVLQQLVDMKRLDEALPLAIQTSENFPLLPRSFFELATVRKARGEWEEEMAALSRALAISPGWGMASRALAEAYERRGDFGRCREILAQAVAFSPLDAHNHGCLADALWHLGEKEAALASLQRAVRLLPDYQWAWETLPRWAAELQLPALAVELARELTVTWGGKVQSWLRLAQVLDDAQIDEKLSALARAELLESRNITVHDQRAYFLAKAGRFEEAAAACHPDAFGEHLPAPLQGRAAWLLAERGDIVAAIESMRRVVEHSPDYYWGWSLLADWLTAVGNNREALRAAENLVRLAPRASAPRGYVADLWLREGKTREAIQAFREAFELDPSYDYAGFRLFDLLLKTSRRQETEEVLRALALHLPGPRVESARVRFQAASRRKKEALQGLRALCFVSPDASFALTEAAEAIAAAGWRRDALRIFRSLLADPAANPEIGALWVRAFTKEGFQFSLRYLRRADPSRPVGLSARFAFLEAASEAGQKRLVCRLVERDEKALRADQKCWGQVGFAFASLRLRRRVVSWMWDWNQRAATPWMLFNLAVAARSEANDALAREVSLRAISLKGDHTTPLHFLLLAWDDAAGGRIDEARARLQSVSAEALKTFYQIVYALVAALCAIDGLEGERRIREFVRQKEILRQEAWQSSFRDPLLKRLGRQTVRAMAARCAMPPFRLGDFWTSFFSRPGAIGFWLILAFLLFVLIAGISGGH